MARLLGRRLLAVTSAALLSGGGDALALDKQGSAHGGAVGGEAGDRLDVSGALIAGVSVANRSYAARPDNSGLALMRYAAHADVDLVGRKLSLPLDVNLFTDRQRRGAAVFAPTELDLIGGVTTTRAAARGADVEVGARVEHDRPVDRGGLTQTYGDVRARLLYSLAKIWPALARDLAGGDVSGYGTLGWFTVNPSYAARPDNSGRALLRYVGHVKLSVARDVLSLGLDGTMFSDRRRADPVAPSELDLTYEVIGRCDPFELHVAYERDMPIDRAGLVQSFVYALVVFNFDLRRGVVEPLEQRGHIVPP
jgi:hypothetical protein